MNINLERYLAGSAFFVRHVIRGGKSRCAVFDRTRRWRQLAIRMAAQGQRLDEIAYKLRRPRASVERVLAFRWRF